MEAILAYGLVAIFFIATLAFALYFARSPRPIDAGPEAELEIWKKPDKEMPQQAKDAQTKNEHPVT